MLLEPRHLIGHVRERLVQCLAKFIVFFRLIEDHQKLRERIAAPARIFEIRGLHLLHEPNHDLELRSDGLARVQVVLDRNSGFCRGEDSCARVYHPLNAFRRSCFRSWRVFARG